MSVQVENLEKSMAKLTIEVSADEFEKATQQAYLKQRGQIAIPGFRKGKAPRAMVEKMYGAGVFFEEAANSIIPKAYEEAAKESGLDIVSQPSIDVTQMEKGKSFIFTAEVAVRPEVTLGEYKGLTAEVAPVVVTDEDVDAEIKRVQEQNSRIVPVEGRAVADGDIAVIDYEGFCDGVAFEGGKGTDHELTIGSHSFIDTFEEQLIGKNAGDECEVNVTFPAEYHAADLAGKPATFKVAVKEIKVKELPELDDDFARDVSDFDTMDEYRNSVKAEIQERKEKAAKTEAENALVEQAVDNATFELPAAMVETNARQMVDDFAQRIQYQGMTIQQYMEYTGMNAQQLVDQMKPQAEKRISTRLVLDAIVKAENIEATDEDVEKELNTMAESYKMEIDKIKEYMGEEGMKSIKEDLAVQKAVDFLYDNATITEKKEEAPVEE